MAEGSSKKAVFAAIAGNALIAVTKFFVAALSGSSAMLSEAIHSVVDTLDDTLLYVGLRRSTKPADDVHPFGYGMEMYFWTLVVATLVFAVGGGMSLYEGIRHLVHPSDLSNVKWNYLALGVALLFEGTSWIISRVQFQKKQNGRGMWRTIRATKDPTIVAVLLEDSVALIGLAVAFLGIYLGHRLRLPRLDGAASLIISLLLMAMAVLLARETRGLLLGESASPETVRDVRAIVNEDPDVQAIARLLTVHFGPQHVVLNLDLQFRPELSASAAATAVDRMEKRIRERHPEIKSIFVEAQAISAREKPTEARSPRSRPGAAPGSHEQRPPRATPLH